MKHPHGSVVLGCLLVCAAALAPACDRAELELQEGDDSLSMLSTKVTAMQRKLEQEGHVQRGRSARTWPVVPPGPSWSVPRVSLPSCLGVLPEWDMQWWYFAGYGTDSANGSYSLFFHVDRVTLAEGQSGTGFYFALGVPNGAQREDLFLYSKAVGMGFATTEEEAVSAAAYLPPVSDFSFDLSHKPLSDAGSGKGFSYSYDKVASDGSALGTAGAVYKLHASGLVETSNLAPVSNLPYEVNLVLKDRRGLVLSGTSYGDAHLAMSPRGSWEFGFPLLDIVSGSLSYGERKVDLVGGTIWNDMQTVQAAPDQPLVPERGIYLGTWSSVTLDNGVAIQVWNLWEQQDEPGQQWISGTKVGRPPYAVSGTAFFPVDKTAPSSNGGVPLWSTDDFNLNILNPRSPQKSPHVKSPDSDKTYCTAWQLDLNVKKLGEFGKKVPSKMYIFPIISGVPEMHMVGSGKPSYFYEASAIVYSDPNRKQQIGRAFMEQMGFN